MTQNHTTQNRLSILMLLVLAAIILALPALWNGFPLLFWDSADYIAMPFTGDIPPFRTASYILMMLPGVLTGTLWTPMALQCLLAAYILYEALHAFAPVPARRALLPATLALTLFTALPWYAGQLMADIFTGLATLGVAILAFGPAVHWTRRAALTGTVALGVAVHTSHLAVTVGLVLVLLGLAVAARLWRGAGWLRPQVRLSVIGLTLGALLAGAANWGVSGQFHIAQSNALLTFARLLQDGIGHRYLADVCPRGLRRGNGETLKLCAVRDRLPRSANSFLWAPGPFYELGGWDSPALKDEAAFIVRDSLKRYPLAHLQAAAGLAWRQLWMLKSGDGLIGLDTIHQGERTTVKSMFMPRAIADYYPADLEAYWDSRQRYGIDLSEINPLHVAVAALGLAGIAVCGLLAFRLRDRRHTGLALMVGLALLGNAFVCGALSNPLDRYQARLAWVAVLACGVIAGRQLQAVAEQQQEAMALAAPAET